MTSGTAQRMRRHSVPAATTNPSGERLVSDPRGEISPAQMVENKLSSILSHSEMRLSDLRLTGPTRYRNHR
jgi:hypothetical protein